MPGEIPSSAPISLLRKPAAARRETSISRGVRACRIEFTLNVARADAIERGVQAFIDEIGSARDDGADAVEQHGRSLLLENDAVDPMARRFGEVFIAYVGGEDDECQVWPISSDPTHEIEPAHFGHSQIKHDKVDRLRRDNLHRVYGASACGDHLPAGLGLNHAT